MGELLQALMSGLPAEVYGLAMPAVIVVAVEYLAKPWLAARFGLVITFAARLEAVAAAAAWSWGQTVLYGVLYGLLAVGLHSSTKHVAGSSGGA